MKIALFLAAALALTATVFAQRGPLTSPVDYDLEREATHNLDVGRQYFKKKAWAGVKGRLEEVVATYPEFTKIDEVYYMLGVSYARSDEAKDARDMFEKLIDARPDSAFAKKAREELDKLPKP